MRLMSKMPKIEFKSDKELMKYLEWWQKKLFLDDWIIEAKICKPEEFKNPDSMGENSVDIVNKCSAIRIIDKKYYSDNYILRYCAEKILVHELLHCKYDFEYADTYEARYLDVSEHALLEQMAKSLIMAKYDLDFEFFSRKSFIKYEEPIIIDPPKH